MFNRTRPPSSFDASGIDFAAKPQTTGGWVGVQGKLVLSFTGLLTLALGMSCWIFLTAGGERMTALLADEARQLSSTLAMTRHEAVEGRDRPNLYAVGQELIRNDNVLYVGFTDAEGKVLALSSRDVDFRLNRTAGGAPAVLMQAHRRQSKVFGGYYEVAAPVFAPRPGGGQRLVGYVEVGVSGADALQQVRHVGYLIVGLGCVLVILSLPLSALLVHRIFLPIRELVAATRRIMSGDLGTAVAAARRADAIGDLGRSFNDMAAVVKRQRQELSDAAESLAEANRGLEEKVDQRTRQLETAYGRLRAEVTEKEDFLRAVSHDLNAPLRNIAGMVTMLLMKQREKLGEDVVHRLERIKKNTEVETDLIAELLDLSRIKTRREKMERVDVGTMIWELRGLFENDLKTRRIELQVVSALPDLWAERGRVRQVFQNLIDNAIKYMGESPERFIRVGAMLRGTEVEFSVSDTGPGFDPADGPKLFYIFRRGKTEATANVPGKGVGLASVKSIVETYDGRIWATGKLGGGACFRFTVNGRFVPELCPGQTGPPADREEVSADEAADRLAA